MKKRRKKIETPDKATAAGSALASSRWEKLELNDRLRQLKATHEGVRNMWANMTDEEKSVEMRRRAVVRAENKRKRTNVSDRES
jgi:hypothetical protein